MNILRHVLRQASHLVEYPTEFPNPSRQFLQIAAARRVGPTICPSTLEGLRRPRAPSDWGYRVCAPFDWGCWGHTPSDWGRRGRAPFDWDRWGRAPVDGRVLLELGGLHVRRRPRKALNLLRERLRARQDLAPAGHRHKGGAVVIDFVGARWSLRPTTLLKGCRFAPPLSRLPCASLAKAATTARLRRSQPCTPNDVATTTETITPES